MWPVTEAFADDVELVLYTPPADRGAPADRCDVRLCSSLLERIEQAEVSVDFAFYGFRDQNALFSALSAAQARGVVVRGVVDLDVDGVNYYDSTAKWLERFPDVGTDLAVDRATAALPDRFAYVKYRCPRPVGFEGPLQCNAFDLGEGRCYLSAHVSREPIRFEGDIMHDKFVVIDHRYVWTGSTNASDSCSGGYNANLVMSFDSPAVAAIYESEFEQLHSGRFHDTKGTQALPLSARIDEDTSVDVYFSPQHAPMTKVVQPLIRGATTSIDLAVFYLTHKGVTQDLVDAKNRGVAVRVILDSTGASNEYTKHEVLRLAGIPVKVEDFGGKMHAKSAVIDGRTVVGGSMNWTNAGEDGNDENTVVLRSSEHAAQYAAWFEATWNRIPERWLEGRPDAESRDSGSSCTDGVDNDYDHVTDAADPGCGASPPPVAELPPFQILPSNGKKCSWDLVDPDRAD